MTRYQTQICLISEQPDPNLFAVLDSGLRPRKVWLLESDDMKRKNKGQDMKNALSRSGVEAVILPVKDPHSATEVNELVESIIYAPDAPPEGEILINITGGTKMMAIGAMMAASSNEVDALYVPIITEKALLFTKGRVKKEFVQEHSLESLKNFASAFFIAHGCQAATDAGGSELDIWRTPDDHEKQFIEEATQLRANDFLYGAAVRELNYLATVAAKAKGCRVPYDLRKTCEGMETLLDIIGEGRFGWVRYEKGTLIFESEERRDFLNGKWMELYVAEALRGVLPPGTTIFNLTAKYEHQSNQNEFDCVFFYKNTLYVMEVKTADLDARKNERQDIVHKLRMVAGKVGGEKVRTCLVSYQPIRERSESFYSMAKGERVHVIDGRKTGPKSLHKELTDWIKQ